MNLHTRVTLRYLQGTLSTRACRLLRLPSAILSGRIAGRIRANAHPANIHTGVEQIALALAHASIGAEQTVVRCGCTRPLPARSGHERATKGSVGQALPVEDARWISMLRYACRFSSPAFLFRSPPGAAEMPRLCNHVASFFRGRTVIRLSDFAPPVVFSCARLSRTQILKVCAFVPSQALPQGRMPAPIMFRYKPHPQIKCRKGHSVCLNSFLYESM